MQNLSAFCENVLAYRKEILTGEYVEAKSAAVQPFIWGETATWAVGTEVANNKHLHVSLLPGCVTAAREMSGSVVRSDGVRGCRVSVLEGVWPQHDFSLKLLVSLCYTVFTVQ